MLRTSALLLLLGLLSAGCNAVRWDADPERSEALARSAAGAATVTESGVAAAPATALKPRRVLTWIELALADSRRLPGDRAQDERRRTAELLRFFRIEQDMTVAELFAGAGYYAEALSFVVGAQGRVLVHNSPASLDAAGEDLAGRFAPGRLANIERVLMENHEIRLPPAAYDAVLMFHAYHDAYHVDPSGGWTPVDGARLLSAIYAALRPGGVLGIVDNVAAADMPAAEAAVLGRIDPARLRADVEAAGFVLESQSDMLRNLAEDRRQSVFSPGVRESADQVVLRFRKPDSNRSER